MANKYKRVPISKKDRFEVFKRDKFTCQYCGKSAPDVVLQVDHIKPVAEGGTNDIMNLITSCFECNIGKGKSKLDDNSTIKKQSEQLKELAERNEQLEMMLKWRDELQAIEDKEVEIFSDIFQSMTGYPLNEKGKKDCKKEIKKYGIGELLECLDISCDQYLDQYGAERVLNSTYRIANCRKKQKDDPKSYWINYLAKIGKNNYSYFQKWSFVNKVTDLLETEDDFQKIKVIMQKSYSWSEMNDRLERYRLAKYGN